MNGKTGHYNRRRNKQREWLRGNAFFREYASQRRWTDRKVADKLREFDRTRNGEQSR